MKMKYFATLILILIVKISVAQTSITLLSAIKADDNVQLSKILTTDSLNECVVDGNWNYSLLSECIRYDANKCFTILIDNKANVNKACDGYVPPLMHAAKYGRLEMLKTLISKGADRNYVYHGDYQPADGETPLTYAEKYHQMEIVNYLKSLPAK